MPLEEYRKKRRFDVTKEPAGGKASKKRKTALAYVIQKHRATALHYDFRLEWNGVLLSWAIPKGPSLDPAVKRMATHVEDHPLEYAAFEGIIPAGEYGGGTVMVWDRGTWAPESPDVDAALAKGELKFRLSGREAEGLVGPRAHEGLGLVEAPRVAPHQAPRRFRLRRGHRGDSPALGRLESAADGDRDRRGRRRREGVDGRSCPRSREPPRSSRSSCSAKKKKRPAVWHSNKSVAENVRVRRARRRFL